MGLVPWALRTLVIAEAEIPFSECDQFPRFSVGFSCRGCAIVHISLGPSVWLGEQTSRQLTDDYLHEGMFVYRGGVRHCI